MYISDVIERAKVLFPTEYTVREYLMWCDELSADVRRNYDIVYDRITADSPEVLLPEGISVNDIAKIIADGKELQKTNLRDFGFEYEYGEQGRILRKTNRVPEKFEIIYAVPHHPTRYTDEDGIAVFAGNTFVCDKPFLTGDTVKITDSGEEYTVHITDMDGEVFFYGGTEIPSGERTVHFYREITEKTLIPAPYDTAYIDFVNARAAMYQGDNASYRNFMEQFNEKMKDYRMYLTRHMPRVKSRFMNWY